MARVHKRRAPSPPSSSSSSAHSPGSDQSETPPPPPPKRHKCHKVTVKAKRKSTKVPSPVGAEEVDSDDDDEDDRDGHSSNENSDEGEAQHQPTRRHSAKHNKGSAQGHAASRIVRTRQPVEETRRSKAHGRDSGPKQPTDHRAGQVALDDATWKAFLEYQAMRKKVDKGAQRAGKVIGAGGGQEGLETSFADGAVLKDGTKWPDLEVVTEDEDDEDEEGKKALARQTQELQKQLGPLLSALKRHEISHLHQALMGMDEPVKAALRSLEGTVILEQATLWYSSEKNTFFAVDQAYQDAATKLKAHQARIEELVAQVGEIAKERKRVVADAKREYEVALDRQANEVEELKTEVEKAKKRYVAKMEKYTDRARIDKQIDMAFRQVVNKPQPV